MVVDTLVLNRSLHYRIAPSQEPTEAVVAIPYEDVVIRNLFRITHADGTVAPYIGPEPTVLISAGRDSSPSSKATSPTTRDASPSEESQGSEKKGMAPSVAMIAAGNGTSTTNTTTTSKTGAKQEVTLGGDSGKEDGSSKLVPPYFINISHEFPFENKIQLDQYWKLEKSGQYTIDIVCKSQKRPVYSLLSGTSSTFFHEIPSELARGTIFEKNFCNDDDDSGGSSAWGLASPNSQFKNSLRTSRSNSHTRPESASKEFNHRPTRIVGAHRTYECLDDSGVSQHIKDLYLKDENGKAMAAGVTDLDHVHLISESFQKAKADKLSDLEMLKLSLEQDIDLHRKFYQNMKGDPDQKFLNCYKKFVQSVMRFCFPDERYMLYQAMPNIRFHIPESATVPPHRDMDIGVDRTPHPAGEENFLYTITDAVQSRAVIMETRPGLGDWTFMEQGAQELLHFYGNRCVHLNMRNATRLTRVSIDFRCIRLEDYLRNQKLMQTRPNEQRASYSLVLGSYYEMMQLTPEFTMQMRPKFDQKEASACYEYLMSDAFATEFKVTKKLEAELAGFMGIKHCFMNCNGTLAISAALNALGIQPGDQVLVPTYTMVASANAVRFIGAVPVFCDVCAETLTISPEIVGPYLQDSSGFNIKCVIHVSLNNRINGLEEIVRMCKMKGVFLLEDAAQSLGTYYKGKHIGSYGDVCTLSFSSPKIISMGQGGAVLTNDDALADKLRKNKDFGRQKPGVEEYDDFGINMKITDVQATIGVCQMQRLPGRMKQVRNLQKVYESVLSNHMLTTSRNSDPGWLPWFCEIFVDDEKTRDSLSNWLKSIGIGTRKVYPSIHLQPAYNDQTMESKMYEQCGSSAQLIYDNNKAYRPNAYKAMQTGLWIPSYADLELKTAYQISLCIRAYLSTLQKFRPSRWVGLAEVSTSDKKLDELEESRGYGFIGKKVEEVDGVKNGMENLLNDAFGPSTPVNKPAKERNIVPTEI